MSNPNDIWLWDWLLFIGWCFQVFGIVVAALVGLVVWAAMLFRWNVNDISPAWAEFKGFVRYWWRLWRRK